MGCSAHNAIGHKPERTTEYIGKIEEHFRNEHGLELKEQVTVYVTKTFREYRDTLVRCGIPDAKKIAENSYAVTSKTNTILVDGSSLSDRHFFFILAHEMVHRYQFENLDDPHGDYVKLEGRADIIASRISGYDIEICDHGIPYDKIRTREGFFSSCRNSRNDTVEQVRYYCRNDKTIT